MPRKPRFYLPGIPVHIVQRGNCRQAVFLRDIDYTHYLEWLEEGATRYGLRIHAYVLMTNHVHLLVTPETHETISKVIQFVGRNYVSYINRRYGKSGTLWEGRHKGCLVGDDHYFLACMRYIELNPVRAGMVTYPVDYDWSSYRGNASGSPAGLLVPHSCYQALGSDQVRRANAYRELFQQADDAERLTKIRATVQSGTPLGNGRFRAQVEKTLECQVGQMRKGRPRKT